MGTTGCYREHGLTDREFFEKEFPNTLTRDGHILECATKNGAFYAAVQDNDTHNVWALIIKITRIRESRYSETCGENFLYKEMDETMGPYYWDCPARILDLLSPTDSQSALEWRAACRCNADALAVSRLIKTGDVVRFDKPMTFTDGATLDTFAFVTRNKFKATYENVGIWRAGGSYRISNWRQLKYEVIGHVSVVTRAKTTSSN